MSNYKNQLKSLVSDSQLNDNQKMLWDLFLNVSKPDEDEAVFEAASEEEENLTLLTKHLRDKIWDMKESDPAKWQEITKDEEKYADII